MREPSLRVLSYNIHKGFSTLDRRFVLQSIKEAIATTGADFVFLQEVVGENSRHSSRLPDWPAETQLEYLADESWPHSAYGKNAVYNEGHHGNAILSRYPIAKWENIDISNNRFERRGLLHATIDTPHGEVHAICVHLDLFEKGRSAQVGRILGRIQEQVPETAPLVIAGDFNDWRETVSPILQSQLGVREVFKHLHGKHARSFPAWFPFLPLDRIYVRGFESLEARCFTQPPWDALSDHGAIFSSLAVKD